LRCGVVVDLAHGALDDGRLAAITHQVGLAPGLVNAVTQYRAVAGTHRACKHNGGLVDTKLVKVGGNKKYPASYK